MNIRNQNNKIIVPKELKLQNIQKVIDKAITPKCQLKWDIFYEKKFNWISIGIYWKRLNATKALSSSNGNVSITYSIQNIKLHKLLQGTNIYHKFKTKMNSEIISKWWLKIQKFETYMILWNYCYYWIHYELSCIHSSFHCLLCNKNNIYVCL